MTKKLTKKDLDYFRELLTERRRIATGDISSIEQSNDGQSAGGDSADQGSDASEREYMLSLLESGTNVVREIDEALERIEAGTYGICLKSGKPIAKARLKAIPWTRYTIEAQQEEERMQF